MTIDEEKYYDNYFDLFNTEGWKQLTQELENIYASFSIDTLSTLEELYKAKGEKEIISRMLHFQNGIEAAYASIQTGELSDSEVVG